MNEEEFYNKYSFRKKHFIYALLICLLLLVLMYTNYRNQLRFSKDPGFYDEGFYLEIYGNKNYDIYYTLDGSEPSTDSLLYHEPIYLYDTSEMENIYSAREDVSTGFYTDLIETYSTYIPGYKVPDYPVDKCNIVRAAMFNDTGECICDITGTYFVGYKERKEYQDIKIVSVISDPDNLFSEESGIYVTGDLFEEYSSVLGTGEHAHEPYWWWWISNYSIRGTESERAGYVEVFSENKEYTLADKCGIRIQGGGSRGFLPKSLGIYARTEYSGREEFEADVFGMGAKQHKFVLFSGGDDCIFKLKDYLVNSLTEELNFSTMDFYPCVLFLNGEFWGTYYITESYNANYFNDHYGVPEDDVIMIKAGTIEDGEESDIQLYHDVREFVSSQDMTLDENYKRAQEMIDISSYIDYYAAQIYIARYNDWPGGNEGMWRTRTQISGSRYADGKWRWILYDVNSGGMDLAQAEADTIAYVMERDGVFASLIQNEEFKRQFIERLLFIAQEVYSEKNCTEFIDKYMDEMLEALCASNMRFYSDEKRNDILANAENMKLFFSKRKNCIKDSIVLHFGEEYVK